MTKNRAKYIKGFGLNRYAFDKLSQIILLEILYNKDCLALREIALLINPEFNNLNVKKKHSFLGILNGQLYQLIDNKLVDKQMNYNETIYYLTDLAKDLYGFLFQIIHQSRLKL